MIHYNVHLSENSNVHFLNEQFSDQIYDDVLLLLIIHPSHINTQKSIFL